VKKNFWQLLKLSSAPPLLEQQSPAHHHHHHDNKNLESNKRLTKQKAFLDLQQMITRNLHWWWSEEPWDTQLD
jgi:hypothetical protein